MTHRRINIKRAEKKPIQRSHNSTKSTPHTANSPRKLDILLHNGNPLRVYCAEVRILEEMNKESLSSLLQGLDSMRLPAQLGPDVSGEEIERDFAD